MAICIIDPGFATTVQDLGRYGYAHLGISPCGAADSLSFRIANRMGGNPENAPALEMTISGATIQFEEVATAAIAGAACVAAVDGNVISTKQAFQIASGSILKCSTIAGGARCYLAIQDGFDVPLVLGSASTHLGARFGGLQGRTLRKGDRLRVRTTKAKRPPALRPETVPFISIIGETYLRITRGVSQKLFEADAFTRLLSEPFTVTPQCGRTGLRLRGERIIARNTSELLTDGIPLGAIQIPPDGQPIILFVDQQTTGGYPKIANVIAADMHLVGQVRPNDVIRFREVSVEEAVQLLHEQENWLKTLFEDA
jgi:antagonist of KipI